MHKGICLAFYIAIFQSAFSLTILSVLTKVNDVHLSKYKGGLQIMSRHEFVVPLL